jgi:hypothetical protein
LSRVYERGTWHFSALKSLGLKYPKIGEEQLAELQKAKEELLNEK